MSDADVCTVVSCAPFTINKNVPHMSPGNFYVPAADNPLTDINVLYVERAITHFYVGNEAGDKGDGWVSRVVPADDLALAIVRDEITSAIEVEPGAAQPGIFWLRGKVSKAEIILKYKEKLEVAREQQKRWFIALVKRADTDWAKIKSPGVVSDLQRKASRALQLKKEWDIEQTVADMANCPMCQKIINPESVICSCGFILNKEIYQKNKDNFVKV